MSTTDATRQWFDKLSDRLNPILVKETRQALKSRQFIATFLLLLGCSWLVSALCLLTLLGNNDSLRGSTLFAYYYFVLAVAALIVVPFSAFRSLQNERDQQTYEVLSVTTLKPRQIVLGKLCSALVQIFIYYSAITPFISFTYLLRGIDLGTILFFLCLGMLEAVILSLATLTLSTLASQRQWQVLLTLLVLGGLTTVQLYSAIAIGSVVSEGQPLPFSDWAFWLVVLHSLVLAFMYCLLFEQVAVSQITFEADNRSSGIRIVTSLLVLLYLCWPLIIKTFPSVPSIRRDEIEVVLVLAALHLGIIGLFLVTEPDILSRRLQRQLHGMNVRRLFSLFYFPQGSRGLWFVALHGGLVLALAAVADILFVSASDMNCTFFALDLLSYIGLYLGLGAALLRMGRRFIPDLRPALVRVMVILLAVGGMLLSAMLSLADANKIVQDLFRFLNPFEMLDGSKYSYLRPTLYLAGACGILINLKAMFSVLKATLSPAPLEVAGRGVLPLPFPASSAVNSPALSQQTTP